ncbi:prepilin-type N-terminal cleavage/methylation domain-containing protein [Jeotgalibaca sp. MA1X17-3]|uniref:competence type IV pilus major pilin ComGC n=1 Tax=Jeotgalibaca sp. MA1X17-3 TaxID=2908211 RepID=UPI001F472355|nr:competence type IV pilus major pilin ComGC [Jeotgalibaca sp. MA1X17-3]UJF14662.1 prepilin-type N-terminal cleavage/methylation domain-containing protein [Jeotgalibaca sp. MA1X17-3]
MKKFRKYLKDDRGFTLVEMVIVLFIISILSLIFIPNIANTKKDVEDDGRKALTTVIQTQADLYEYKNSERPTLDVLAEKKYITDGQKQKAIEWGILTEVIE